MKVTGITIVAGVPAGGATATDAWTAAVEAAGRSASGGVVDRRVIWASRAPGTCARTAVRIASRSVLTGAGAPVTEIGSTAGTNGPT